LSKSRKPGAAELAKRNLMEMEFAAADSSR
jgi:hypothetical protein